LSTQGSNVVYGITDFAAPMRDPAARSKMKPGQTFAEYIYETSLQHGKNIVDAVASTADSTLENYVWSSLSAAREHSHGKYNLYHFDAKGDVVTYAKTTYSALWAKMSVLELALYDTNWKINPLFGPQKV
jgi:hypothetical protein